MLAIDTVAAETLWNNSSRFCLAIAQRGCHKRKFLTDRRDQNDQISRTSFRYRLCAHRNPWIRPRLIFLLNVPAGEGSLAHRRHVPSRLIELDSLTDQLDFERIFGRNAPLHVDLGCGAGSFLCALAQRMSEKNFLGIDRLLNRIRSAVRKAANLANVRLLRLESSYALRYLLPPASVETFYLLFPDPWPKRRHHGRRIVTGDFLSSVHTALDEDGMLLIATDHLDYFREVRRVVRNHSGFATEDVADCCATRQPLERRSVAKAARRRRVDLPLTKFQEKFRAQCTPIYWVELRKVSPVR
jgi:tRNA (guanine-N7-)-methyltransferase